MSSFSLQTNKKWRLRSPYVQVSLTILSDLSLQQNKIAPKAITCVVVGWSVGWGFYCLTSSIDNKEEKRPPPPPPTCLSHSIPA